MPQLCQEIRELNLSPHAPDKDIYPVVVAETCRINFRLHFTSYMCIDSQILDVLCVRCSFLL